MGRNESEVDEEMEMESPNWGERELGGEEEIEIGVCQWGGA